MSFLTFAEQAELQLLQMANAESGKMAFEFGATFEGDLQGAMERLQIQEWIRFIDVSQVAEYPQRLFRIYVITDAGRRRRDDLAGTSGHPL